MVIFVKPDGILTVNFTNCGIEDIRVFIRSFSSKINPGCQETEMFEKEEPTNGSVIITENSKNSIAISVKVGEFDPYLLYSLLIQKADDESKFVEIPLLFNDSHGRDKVALKIGEM